MTKTKRQSSAQIDDMTLNEKLALRAKHTCMRDMSSLRCIACNLGTPFPALSSAELEATFRRR